MDGIDDLERYLGKIELKNFGIIKNVFQQRENIFNDKSGLTVYERHELITKEKCSSLDDYGLFLYEMKRNIPKNVPVRLALLVEKRVLISTEYVIIISLYYLSFRA